MTEGQREYERDVARTPFYHDGKPRKRWNELPQLAHWSWEKIAENALRDSSRGQGADK